jgi:hypothetical protein
MKKPKPYNGPAKPIPTHRELISDKAERVFFLILAVVFALLLLTGVI